MSRPARRMPRHVRERLIVALDVPTLAQARRLVRALAPDVVWCKVGSILFTAAGPAAIDLVHRAGGRVFLDLKFHDIPHTVARACDAARRHQVDMLTLHVQGGAAMLRAARQAITHARPALIGITHLTSDQRALQPRAVAACVRQARAARLDGVVAPPHLIAQVRRLCGPRMRLVTPGIRPSGARQDEHARPMTPAYALRQGADFVVVGRPIIQARDPRAAALAILEEMHHAC